MQLTCRPTCSPSYRLPGSRSPERTNIARILVVAAALALSFACSGSDSSKIGAQANSVVLLTVDGLRADRLGCYGHDLDTSPNLDALAREAVLFEWAFSQAVEPVPSLVSIFTGLYPTTHDVGGPEDALREEAATLAEILSGRGYGSAAFLAGGPSTAGLGQGFGLFDVGEPATAEEFTSKVSAWLEEHASEDFLLAIRLPRLGSSFLSRFDQREASSGAFAPEELERAKSAYEDQVRSLDEWIGGFMETVRRLGIDRRATIAFVATHGLGFQEHGGATNHALHTSWTRVPLLLRLPEGRGAGSIDKFVETLDLMPTLLELTGAEVPAAVQGRSLLPLIEGNGKPPYVAFGESSRGGGQRFAALGGYRLLVSRGDETAKLYRLPDDPLELNDLAGNDSEAERLAVLRRHLDAWEEMVAAASLDPDVQEAPMDEETLERLRSLGYIQ